VADRNHCKIEPMLADRNRIAFLKEKNKALLPGKYKLVEGNDPITFTELLKHSLSLAIDHIENLKSGVLHHKTDPNAPYCQSYCTYRRMCQKNIAKLQRTWDQQ